MELRIYLKMLQRGWWIVALTGLIALFVALVVSFFSVPIYRTSARFVVSPNPSLVTGRDVVTSLEALDKRSIVSTYAEFLNSARIFDETLQELGIVQSDAAQYTHTTVVLPDANILELSVDGPNPQVTATIANSLGQRAISYIRSLYQVYDITFLDPASVPAVPIRPQPLRDGALALVLGVVIGAVLAILREQISIPLDAYRQRQMMDRSSSAFTRRYLMRRLEGELARDPNGVVSFGLIRLNGLLDLIDGLPQPVTQRILNQVTNVLRKELRGNDLIGRWTDVTFAVMLASTNEGAASRTVERIRQALLVPIEIEPGTDRIALNPQTAVATYQGNESAIELTERAEHALD